MPTRGPRLTLERALAVLGLLGLFLVAGICASMIAGAAGEDEPSPTRAAEATSTREPEPEPTATPKPEPTPVALTPQQRAQRRAAARVVREQGFDPVSLKAYHSDQTLRVLLGETSATSRANGVPAGRRAFFFVGDTFVDTDAPEPSTSLQIIRQTENTVTLSYGLAGGAKTRVRFRWDGGALGAQSPVPPAPQRLQ
jgi:hypothetical protein